MIVPVLSAAHSIRVKLELHHMLSLHELLWFFVIEH